MNSTTKKDILLVCKDTGAANALSTFIKNWDSPTTQIFSICIGHAIKVFRSNNLIPSMESDEDFNNKKVEEIINEIQPGAIFVGTSLDSWTERYSIMTAKKKGIYCLGLVDWWSNFGARFSNPGTRDLAYLPDEIAVMDEDAKFGCIDDGIPDSILSITGNPYWDFLIKRKDLIKLQTQTKSKLGISDQTLVVVVISSDIRNLNLNLGYDEHDFWKAVVPLPDYNKRGAPIKWVFKPHPREKLEDINNMLKEYDIKPIILDDFSPIETIALSDFVVGMCSSLLFEAALLGKKIVSIQPSMNGDTLKYLRIFDHISVPKVIDSSKVRYTIEHLINQELDYPKLGNIPYPMRNGKASSSIKKLLMKGIKNTK